MEAAAVPTRTQPKRTLGAYPKVTLRRLSMKISWGTLQSIPRKIYKLCPWELHEASLGELPRYMHCAY